MDQLLVQRTRYRLQARVRRARSCNIHFLPTALRYLFQFIESDPVLGPTFTTVVATYPDLPEQVENAKRARQHLTGETESEQVALSVHLLRKITKIEDGRGLVPLNAVLGCPSHKMSEIADFVRDHYLEPLHEYLDEQIDYRNVLLGVIRQYKHQREWFGRERLRAIPAGHEGKTGERALCVDLYEYLYEQGVEFTVETESASGRIDLLIHQGDDRSTLPIDAKYIRDGDEPAKITKTIAAGFRQVYDYCCDFQQPIGYLVIFKETSRTIDIVGEIDDSFPALRVGNRTIYFVEVDMCSYEGSDGQRRSASRRGRAEVVRLSSAELIELVQNEAGAGDGPEADQAS